ncbi:MAG: helix-turn-helix domain-containing protein [Fusobacteriaceae bacterium]|nr:helix-turn-helix domain-containing protein [Fusobacteriaceae bacterium]
MLQSFDKLCEKYDSIESENLRILYYNLDKGYEDDYRSYNYYRFCTILTGKKDVSINNDKNFTYDSSEYILLPPQSSVHMKISSHTKAVVYEISPHIIDKVSNQVQKKFEVDDFILKKSYSRNLLETVKTLSKNIYKNEQEAKFLMDLYSQELVYRIIDENKSQKSYKINNYYSPAQGAKDIIEKPGNEILTISEIAEILGMSQANLDYYFKKDFNITPKKYQNQIKIDRARYLLKENNVTEVAMSLGFENISHFIRLFKEAYGVTPKQYK